MKKVTSIISLTAFLSKIVCASSTKIGFSVGKASTEVSKTVVTQTSFNPTPYIIIALALAIGFAAFKKSNKKPTKKPTKKKSKPKKKKK